MRRVVLLAVLIWVFGAVVAGQVVGGCPAVEIRGPGELTLSGRPMEVSVDLPATLRFEWTVSMGEIVRGQGTRSIEIRTPPIDPVTADLTVNLKVDGLPASCRSTASAKFGVYVIADLSPFDEYYDDDPRTERARMVQFAEAIASQAGSTAYIILNLKPYRFKTEIARRVKRIRSQLSANRKWPKSQLVILARPSDDPKTQLWIIPKGASLPDCPHCRSY